MRPRFLSLVVAVLLASGGVAALSASGQDPKGGGDELPPLPSVNATHFVVLASASGDEAERVRLRVVMPVSGPNGPERWMQTTVLVDGKACRVTNTKGSRVDPGSLRESLKKLTPVLLALGETPIRSTS